MTGPLEFERHVDDYLAIRKAVGLTNTRHGRELRDFIDYAKNIGATDGSPIRAATAVSWAWDHAPATCGIRGARRSAYPRSRLSQLSGCDHSGNRSAGLARHRRRSAAAAVCVLR